MTNGHLMIRLGVIESMADMLRREAEQFRQDLLQHLGGPEAAAPAIPKQPPNSGRAPDVKELREKAAQEADRKAAMDFVDRHRMG